MKRSRSFFSLAVPGLDELPLAVQVAAVDEAPAVEAVHAGIRAADHQFRVLQPDFVAAGPGMVVRQPKAIVPNSEMKSGLLRAWAHWAQSASRFSATESG